MKMYLSNVAAAFSVVLNTVLGGTHRHTFSARTGHASFMLDARWAILAERVIDLAFGKGHCHQEYLNEFFHYPT